MKIVGLTGGSGTGKGTVAEIFAEYGIPSVDTDAVYHELLENNRALNSELAAAFGTGILGESGKVNRSLLAATVFGKENTPALLHTLNQITHKYVMSETKKRLAEYANTAPVALIDAPLLFEAGLDAWCEEVIGVLADRETRILRVTGRDGIDRAAAIRRIDAQPDDNFFRERCNIVLENNGDLAQLKEKVRKILAAWKMV